MKWNTRPMYEYVEHFYHDMFYPSKRNAQRILLKNLKDDKLLLNLCITPSIRPISNDFIQEIKTRITRIENALSLLNLSD